MNNERTEQPRINTEPLRKYWKKIRENGNLKNFTIISILLILVGFTASIFSHNNDQSLLQPVFILGALCCFLAYFVYAVKSWGSDHPIGAVLMVTIPLLVDFLATSKILGSTTNFLFYIFIQFCFYAFLSAILLYVSNKVRAGIGKVFFEGSGWSVRYFYPKLSYSIAGVIFISFLLINLLGAGIFSENVGAITQSFQKMNSPPSPISQTPARPISASAQNLQVLPTIPPDVVKGIESTVGNSAPIIDISTLEMQIHTGINQQRQSNGLSSLRFDPALEDIARKHSADMARSNYFAHVNRQGLDPTARGNQAGYSCYKNYGSYFTSGIAENIFQNNLYDSVTYYNGIPRYAWNSQEDLAQSTVEGWMNSPGHRKNILTVTYDREGIGVAIASDNKVYITEDFC
jgi:uncharacterized protein YkwD